MNEVRAARYRKRLENALPTRYFPIDEWRLVERRFMPELLGRTETLFALANGYIGMRGVPEEGRPAHEHGTFVAGFHEQWPIEHAEVAYGLAHTGQTIIDVPDPKLIKLYVDDEPLYLPHAELSEYERVLDMRSGLLERSLVWETASGKKVQVKSRRLVSFHYRHLAAFEFEVTVLNADAPIVISSQLVNREDTAPEEKVDAGDPRATRKFPDRVLNPADQRVDDQLIILGYHTTRSRMALASGVDHHFETNCDHQVMVDADHNHGKVVYIVNAQAGEPIKLTKYATYHTSRTAPAEELVDRAERVLRRAQRVGMEELVAVQREFVADFWDRSDVIIDDQPELQQAVRWNLFQLLQASARVEGDGIPAKGLTGSGYEGQYFWDIELFVAPFLTYTAPRIARNLIRFRHSLLDKARERAAELSHNGALYPWRTITGDEASAYYAAGTAQYHINADVVYAMKRYADVTGDDSLVLNGGAAVLVETARLWLSLGFYGDDGYFHLHSVTGPDEYTAVVNDNAYTNLMARLNLRWGAETLEHLQQHHPDRIATLEAEIGLTAEEVAEWRRAADRMFVPYDEQRRIHAQDAQFLERKRWDFADTPAEKYPLLLHFHPLTIYRHQVLKQADVILAMVLLSDEFSTDQKERNYRYYDPLTTSDSSLAPPIHAIMAREVGDHEHFMSHFAEAVFMDLSDLGSNTHQGVHVASTGGVWLALVCGVGGLRDHDGKLVFNPSLPPNWPRMRFPLQAKGQRFDVELTHEQMTFTLRKGDGLTVGVRGEDIHLEAATPVSVPLGDT